MDIYVGERKLFLKIKKLKRRGKKKKKQALLFVCLCYLRNKYTGCVWVYKTLQVSVLCCCLTSRSSFFFFFSIYPPEERGKKKKKKKDNDSVLRRCHMWAQRVLVRSCPKRCCIHFFSFHTRASSVFHFFFFYLLRFQHRRQPLTFSNDLHWVGTFDVVLLRCQRLFSLSFITRTVYQTPAASSASPPVRCGGASSPFRSSRRPSGGCCHPTTS